MSLGRLTPVVIDASAIGEYLLGTPFGSQVGGVMEGPDAVLNVPMLCDIEVSSAVRRFVRMGDMDLDRGARSLRAYVDLPIRRFGHLPLLGRIFELRENFTSYDATYVALAEQLGATLITGDDRLTRAVREHLQMNVIGTR